MKRRPASGQLSLFDALATTPVAPARVRQDPTSPPKARPPEPLSPPYIVNGAFIMPYRPGETTAKQWFCVCDPSGAYRDALAILYAVIFREGSPVAISCPVLGQRWDALRDYGDDCIAPFYEAVYVYAAGILDVPQDTVPGLCYFTCAHSTETRAEQRDVPPLGSVRPEIMKQGAPA